MKRKENLMWSLSLYGTAIGAGVLFLPIQAGISGIIPIAIMLLFIFPMVFLSHRALCRFVISSPNGNHDITHVADEYFGKHGGFFFNILYLLAIFPILLVYSVGITNTLQSFLHYQLEIDIQNRFLLSFCTIFFVSFYHQFWTTVYYSSNEFSSVSLYTFFNCSFIMDGATLESRYI